MTADGLAILDSVGSTKAMLYLNDNSLGKSSAPALKLGSDNPVYLEKYFDNAHNVWLGNGSMTTGIRINMSSGLIYKRENGTESAIAGGTGGTMTAVFA